MCAQAMPLLERVVDPTELWCSESFAVKITGDENYTYSEESRYNPVAVDDRGGGLTCHT